MLIQELPCLDSNIAGQLLLIEFCNKILSGADIATSLRYFGLVPIVLQKSKVEGAQIFRKKTERKSVTDSYDLNRITEIACEFIVRR